MTEKHGKNRHKKRTNDDRMDHTHGPTCIHARKKTTRKEKQTHAGRQAGYADRYAGQRRTGQGRSEKAEAKQVTYQRTARKHSTTTTQRRKRRDSLSDESEYGNDKDGVSGTAEHDNQAVATNENAL